VSECRLDYLSSQQAANRLAEAAVAYVPIGSIEFHGPHLPMGVDMFTAQGLCIEAARRSGGVVLPPSYLANGCLDLPHTLNFEPALVEAWTRSVVQQLHHRGVVVVVLVTGHGPLDLIHLLKRVADSLDRPGARAYGLCYLELTAARLDEPEDSEPTVIDHASTVETSWMLALEPELVRVDLLDDDPSAITTGVYGRNPRFTATADFGAEQIAFCADLLSQRVAGLLEGTWSDDRGDLVSFVANVWPEPLTLTGSADSSNGLILSIGNPGRASRYISGIADIRVSGRLADMNRATCRNSSPGETGARVSLMTLDAEHGVYIRRGQVLEVLCPAESSVTVGSPLEFQVELGGVNTATVYGSVLPTPDQSNDLETSLTRGPPVT